MSGGRPGADAVGMHRIEDDGISLLDYAAVVWRHRWLIVSLCMAGVLTGLGVSLIMPRMYESTAAVLVPKESVSGGLLTVSGILQQMPGLSVPSVTSNRDTLVSVLKSRTMAQAVVEGFRLQERYRVRFLEDAIRKLEGMREVSVSREGAISIKVEDTDPQVAAQMANFYVEQLDRLVARFGTGEAGRQRRFITEQVARTKGDLERAEEALRRFQERNRAIVLQEQTRAAIESVARLKGEVMAAEVQLQVMRNFATEANPEMVALRRRIEEMRKQLAQMQYGDGGPVSGPQGRDRRDFTVPFPKVPEVGLELARLTRDVKVQETLVTLLTQHLEQAKIAEARDILVVQPLDLAVPAERHSRPRTRLNAAIGGATSLFIGIFLAFFIEYVGKLRRVRRPT